MADRSPSRLSRELFFQLAEQICGSQSSGKPGRMLVRGMWPSMRNADAHMEHKTLHCPAPSAETQKSTASAGSRESAQLTPLRSPHSPGRTSYTRRCPLKGSGAGPTAPDRPPKRRRRTRQQTAHHEWDSQHGSSSSSSFVACHTPQENAVHSNQPVAEWLPLDPAIRRLAVEFVEGTTETEQRAKPVPTDLPTGWEHRCTRDVRVFVHRLSVAICSMRTQAQEDPRNADAYHLALCRMAWSSLGRLFREDSSVTARCPLRWQTLPALHQRGYPGLTQSLIRFVSQWLPPSPPCTPCTPPGEDVVGEPLAKPERGFLHSGQLTSHEYSQIFAIANAAANKK